MTRRKFISMGTTLAMASALPADTGNAPLSEKPLKVRFLGTGAADWTKELDAEGMRRRFSSILLDDDVLVDFHASALDMIPEGIKPSAVFYTHSHYDHYNPSAALKAGVKNVYCECGWAKEAREEFAAAAMSLGVEPPKVHELKIGEKAVCGNLAFLPLPASHMTRRKNENALIYLIEKNTPKGLVRLLYAVDTSVIVARAAILMGIDLHGRGEGITAVIFEATNGAKYHEDFRLFSHASTLDVERFVKVITKTGRYRPHTPDQKVYLTHMAKELHPTHSVLAKSLPSPLTPAYDGLEVYFG